MNLLIIKKEKRGWEETWRQNMQREDSHVTM